MKANKINGDVTTTVTLGANGYGNHLIIIITTRTVKPSAYGTAGIVDPANVQNAVIDNKGAVREANGGPNGHGQTGGIGIDFAAAGSLSNSGAVDGSKGGYGRENYAGRIGVDLTAGGSIHNFGRQLHRGQF